jgi:hypothetical protein
VYPNIGQSVAEPAVVAADVVGAVVVVVANGAGTVDFPPPQAVATSATQPISSMRLTGFGSPSQAKPLGPLRPNIHRLHLLSNAGAIEARFPALDVGVTMR